MILIFLRINMRLVDIILSLTPFSLSLLDVCSIQTLLSLCYCVCLKPIEGTEAVI